MQELCLHYVSLLANLGYAMQHEFSVKLLMGSS